MRNFIIFLAVFFLPLISFSQRMNIRVRVDAVYQSVYDNKGANTRPRWRIHPKITFTDGTVQTFTHSSYHDNCDCTDHWKIEGGEIINIETEKFPKSFTYDLEAWEEEGDNDFNPNRDDDKHEREGINNPFNFPQNKIELIQSGFEPYSWKQGQYSTNSGNYAARVSVYYTLPQSGSPKLSTVETICDNNLKDNIVTDQLCAGKNYTLDLSNFTAPDLADEYQWNVYKFSHRGAYDIYTGPKILTTSTPSLTMFADNPSADKQYDKILIRVYSRYKGSISATHSSDRIFYIYPPPPENVTIKVDSVTCYNTSTGKINITGVTGGRSPYKFTVRDESGAETYSLTGSTGTFNNLHHGRWKLTVENYEGNTGKCGKCFDVFIGQPEAPLTFATDTSKSYSTALRCFGVNSGELKVVSYGGTKPYKYSIDGGATFHPQNSNVYFNADTCIFNKLFAGTYQVKVEDKRGCTFESQPIKEVKLHQPPALKVRIRASEYYINQHFKCFGDSSASFTILASGGAGTYQYSIDGNYFSSNSYFTNLSQRSYTGTVLDKNGCEGVTTINLYPPAPINIESLSLEGPKCFGGDNGSVQIQAKGGTNGISRTYSYKLSSNTDSWTKQGLKVDFKNLTSKEYIIKITDDYNCIKDSIVTIKSPNKIAFQHVTKDVICKGESNGEASIVGTGGTGKFSFEWKEEATNVKLVSTQSAPKTSSINKLKAGQYIFTAIDENGCLFPNLKTDVSSITIKEPIQAISIATDKVQNVKCFGESNGEISIKAQGGWGTFVYSKDKVSFVNQPVFDKLKKATYSLYAKDVKGCIDSIKVNVEQPSALAASVSSFSNALCYQSKDGSINVKASGGTQPYLYSLNKEATEQSSTEFNNLKAGSYTIKVKDKNSCITDTKAEIKEPTKLQLSLINKSDASCGKSLGEIEIEAKGGVGNYSYSWTNLTSTEPSVFKLLAGKYTAIARDKNNCKDTLQIFINDGDGPKAIEGNVAPTSCSYSSDGKAEVLVTGGHKPYNYFWPAKADYQKTAIGKNLLGGEYLVEVLDSNECKGSVIIKVPSPDELSIKLDTSINPTCEGYCDGQIKVSVNGGVGMYKYEWKGLSLNNNQLKGLCKGEYQLSLRDKNNCLTVQSFQLEDPNFKIEIGDSAVICKGQVLTLEAPNEESSLTTYQWTSENGLSSTERQIKVNDAGKYFLKVISEKGCLALDTFKVITSTSLLKANFMMSPKAIAYDTLVAIEISWPEPEWVSWRYPAEFKLIKTDNEWQYFQLPGPGKYKVNLSVWLGECADVMEKEIVLLDPSFYDSLESARISYLGLEELSLYPNPNDGKFIMEILLTDEMPVEVFIYDILKPTPIEIRNQKDNILYKMSFNMDNLIPGFYYAKVKTPYDFKTVKFLIQKH